MSSFHYPELSRGDMISILQELQVATVTENDLRNPVPEYIADLYTRLLVHIGLINEEDQGQLEFDAMEHLENPEYHADSIWMLTLYTRIRELVNSVHCPLDFTLKDLLRPHADRTGYFLGSILNFCLHKDAKLEHLRSLGDELTLLGEQQAVWDTKIAELNGEIASFNAEREQEGYIVQELSAKVKELRLNLVKLSTEQGQLRTNFQNLKEEVKEMDGEIGKAEFSLVQSVHENASLRSKIVQSPDKLQRSLEEKKSALQDVKDGERKAKESFQTKSEQLELYTKALRKLTKHLTWMQSAQDQVNSAKAIEKEYKALKAKLGDEEVLDKSLSAKIVELQGKVQQLSDMKRAVENETNQRAEEATSSVATVRDDVESRRRNLEAKQKNVEALLSEADAVNVKANWTKDNAAEKVQDLIRKREEVVKQFEWYKEHIMSKICGETAAPKFGTFRV